LLYNLYPPICASPHSRDDRHAPLHLLRRGSYELFS
jgi:hypothetical protein